MSPLGKRIIIFSMMWVFLVMIVLQMYDNVTGKGMPASRAAVTPTALAAPDPDVTRLAELQTCVANNPDNLECVRDLAAFYYEVGQYPQAQVNYERAVKLDPQNVALLMKLAGTYIYQLKFPQAAATLQQASSLQPDSPEIHLLLGLSYSKLEPPKKVEAVAEWRQVKELAPGSNWAQQADIYIREAGQ